MQCCAAPITDILGLGNPQKNISEESGRVGEIWLQFPENSQLYGVLVALQKENHRCVIYIFGLCSVTTV
jgi:hypothetical protein